VAPSFGLGASSFARLKFSGIEKEKFVMGVTQRTRKLRYSFVTFFMELSPNILRRLSRRGVSKILVS
jgi:hypothetical protein